MRAGGIVLIAGLLLAGVSGAESRADIWQEVEPNDQPGTAQPLLPAASVGGVILTAGDRDLYTVRLGVAQTIRADILARGFRADTNPGSDLSARLRILDGDGVTVLAEDSSQGPFDDPAVALKVFTAGVYYISVDDMLGGGSSNHVYVLSVETGDNGSFSTATPIVPPVLASIDCLIWPAGDHDFYRFDATAGQTVTVDIDSAVFNPSVPPVKAVINLYKPDQTLLASDGYSTADPNDPLIHAVLPVTGAYFIEVRDLRSFVGTDNSFYQLSVELGPSTDNNSVATATPILLPRGVSGVISPSGDTDHFAFLMNSPATVTANVDAREGLLSLLLPTLTLLNSGGATLATGSGSPDPSLSAPVGPGDYVMRVGGSSTGLSEDAYYRLWIDADADGDGIRLPQDVCPMVADPMQSDTDHDGVGDACDACLAVFNPGQERNLRVQEPVGDTLVLSGAGDLAWEMARAAVTSNVYRAAWANPGVMPSFGCLLDNVMLDSAQDPQVPPPGAVFGYLVTAENCNESVAGDDSSGNIIVPSASCPLPL